jgi:hypothetical protein
MPGVTIYKREEEHSSDSGVSLKALISLSDYGCKRSKLLSVCLYDI